MQEASDLQLFGLVAVVLVGFYLMILFVITSADKEREASLKKLK